MIRSAFLALAVVAMVASANAAFAGGRSSGSSKSNNQYVRIKNTGTANLATDPLFVDQPNRDFRPRQGSPAVDSGSNALVPVGTTIDFAGLPRFIDDPLAANTGAGTAPIVDRGAHERQVPPPPPCPADLNGNGSVDAADLAVLLNAWGGSGTGDLDGNSIVDAADLAALLNAWGPCP